MAIYRILERSAFGPEEIKLMTDAYDVALDQLGITNREDPLTELIAKYVMEEAQTGEKSFAAISARALKRLQDVNER
jgi:hypothetical protein